MMTKTPFFILKSLFISLSVCCFSLLGMAQGQYVAGDFHQHSTYTDGSYTIGHVMQKNADFGLDWWANSEHGGAFNQWGEVSGKDLGTSVTWSEAGIPLLGDATNGNMFRWQSLRDWSFRDIQLWRRVLSGKLIVQGYEMNVPGHEHGSVGIIGDQFAIESPNVNALAEFEYKFDGSDTDISGGAALGWSKSSKSGHAKTLEAIKWLQDNYNGQAWLVPAHPERKKLYTIAAFRDMNSAGPDVCFGFESMPGHQKEAGRGGYSSSADGGGTFGGCGVYAAKVGGLWDAMLSEGRKFWLFASSDFHDVLGDFYPGEYQKTYTYVSRKNDPKALVEGLKSGNSWVVEGDLISSLDFKLVGEGKATMGEDLNFQKQIEFQINITDPNTINNFGMNPVLDHIDLIMGKITGMVDPSSPDYNNPSAPATKVIARFDNVGGVVSEDGVKSIKWSKTGNGIIKINYILKNVEEACYFRLRGTNHMLNEAGETDSNGNPLLDPANTAEKAINDLWFYSNPVFAYPASQKLKSASIGNTIGLQELSGSAVVTAFPIPASGKVYFSNVADNSDVEVYNMSGELVLKTKTTGTELNIAGLGKGPYIASIHGDQGENKVKFIVK